MVEKLSSKPLINLHPGVFTSNICQEIISMAKNDLMPSKVIKSDGSDGLNSSYRDASTCSYPKNHNSTVELVYDTIEKLTGIGKERFENFTVTHYTTGQFYKHHQDYFHYIDSNPESLGTRCKKGGNRVATVILYLNTPPSGGETYFPWLDVSVVPNEGSVLHFDYGYEDQKYNIQTTHAGLPPLDGEKWIVTFWARESNITEEVTSYRRFITEGEIQRKVNNIEYTYTFNSTNGGTLNIQLEGNYNSLNTLVVGFNGSKKSTLLLYILAALNNLQEIPWLIQPVCIASREQFDGNPSSGILTDIKNKANLVKILVGGNIRATDFVCVEDKSILDRNSILYSLFKYIEDSPRKRFRDNRHIYVADTASTYSLDSCNSQQIYKNMRGLWFSPFENLSNENITELIHGLNLDFIK